jgi:hypothetical protein
MTARAKNRVDMTWEYRRPEHTASRGSYRIPRGRGCQGSLQVLLEPAREFDESGRQADVFVRRVSMVVARDDLRPSFIGHGGCNFVQAGMQQVGNELFDLTVRKQCGQGMQSRGVVEIQANRVLFRGPYRHRFFLPTIEQGLEFHDLPRHTGFNIAHYSRRRPAEGLQMNMEFSHDGKPFRYPFCLRLVK